MSRMGYGMATCCAAAGLAVATLAPMPLKLIWNASASTPIGLYVVHPTGRLSVTDLVVVRAPEPLAEFLGEGGYLPRDVPLMKRVAALPGQSICRSGRTVFVDGAAMAEARDRDRLGRSLPAWQGCRLLAEGEIFLLNRRVPDSFDGRYFGPLPASSVVGRVVPLWTDEGGDGRFRWRAAAR
jgi:conjugative transfer signal peptidase TraF